MILFTNGEPLDLTRHVYVAGPMTGYPKKNYPKFEAAAAMLRATGFERVVSPHELNTPETPYAEAFRKDLAALLTCNCVALLPGWASSRGANAEVQVATLLGLPVMMLFEPKGGA